MTTREVKQAVRLQEWGQMVKRCQESGLTIPEWCSQNSIKPSCYYYRLAQVRKAVLQQNQMMPSTGQEQPAPTLVKVNMTPTEHAPFSAPAVSGERFFHLRYSSAILDIPVGTQAEDIVEVLKAMGQHVF